MAASSGPIDEIERLKALLFRPEAERLASAEAQIEHLESRVGDARRLEDSTTEILVAALRRTEAAQHQDLANAVAPVVVASIRNEIVNSKEMMIEALYPITGRLVSSGIAQAFRELTERINQRLEDLMSSRSWSLRLQSWTTGRPVAEIALAQARGASVQSIFLLEGASGKLLAHWRAGAGVAENPDLVSGMIAAISGFAANVLSAQHGELRNLDLGASTIYLRASARLILAAEFIGELNRADQQRLDESFAAIVDRCERGIRIDDKDLSGLERWMAAPGAAKTAGASAKWRWAAAALVALFAIAWFAYAPILRGRKEAAISAAFQSGVAAQPPLAAYPLTLSIDSAAQRVTLRGLASQPEAIAALEEAMKPVASPYQINAEVDYVASAAALRSTQANLAARVDALSARVDASNAQLAGLEQTQASAVLANQAAQTALAQHNLADLTILRDRIDTLSSGGAFMTTEQAGFSADVAALRANIDSLKSETAQVAADSSLRLNEQASALASRIAAQADQLTAAGKELAALRQPAGSAHQHLRELLAGSAIFFSAHYDFADAAAAKTTLDAIAALLVQSGDSLRVVGYSDETGGIALNVELARRRAELIAQRLVDRGVPPSRLISVGRGAQSPIADFSTPEHVRNRRVAFELAFSDEALK